MRPSFISPSAFRSWLSLNQLNAVLIIDGIRASSFIDRCARIGRAVRHMRNAKKQKLYRPLDVVACATAMGLQVSPPFNSTQQVPPDSWSALILERHEIAPILQLSNQLTGKCLLTEAEIVSVAGQPSPTSAVYFLVKKGKVIYVGQTRHLSNRIEQHKLAKDFEAWAFIECDIQKLDVLESLYIHLLRPRLNGKRGESVVAPLTLDSLTHRACGLRKLVQQSASPPQAVSRSND